MFYVKNVLDCEECIRFGKERKSRTTRECLLQVIRETSIRKLAGLGLFFNGMRNSFLIRFSKTCGKIKTERNYFPNNVFGKDYYFP